MSNGNKTPYLLESLPGFNDTNHRRTRHTVGAFQRVAMNYSFSNRDAMLKKG